MMTAQMAITGGKDWEAYRCKIGEPRRDSSEDVAGISRADRRDDLHTGRWRSRAQRDNQRLPLQPVAEEAIGDAKQSANHQHDDGCQPWRHTKADQIEQPDIRCTDDEGNGQIETPSSATNVWPTEASPRKEAKRSIDLMLLPGCEARYSSSRLRTGPPEP